MGSCKEFALDDLMAIAAVPVSKYTPSGTTMLAPAITDEDTLEMLDGIVDADAIVIGKSSKNGSALIPIMRGTGKVKDSENLNTAGRLHTVSVECEVDDRESEAWTLLHRLERMAAHLILTSRDGSRFFVQGSDDTYLCTVNRDGEKTGISLKVQCMMGAQMIIHN
jgi:hypothetical protein